MWEPRGKVGEVLGVVLEVLGVVLEVLGVVLEVLEVTRVLSAKQGRPLYVEPL